MSRTDESTPSRYVVGIDLGTTNCALASVDTSKKQWRVEPFVVPQLVSPGEVERRETLPSFLLSPREGTYPPQSLKLPWQQEVPGWVTGVMARDEGRTSPDRLISSAKSWLCHPGVDRTGRILPWHGDDDVDRMSPIEASAHYLAHLRDAWDAAHPGFPLAEQEIVLTLPASFDEIARESTVAAARQAQLPRVVLIEEPQAAFYAWIDQHRDNWDQLVQPGQTILVCDIGGGTSDFTLIRVRRAPSGLVDFHRVAVGEHLLLGGDNLDLALARHLEPRLTQGGRQLSPDQWSVLLRSCRRTKEQLLGEDAPDEVTVSIPGRGAALVGGSIQTQVTREEVATLLVDGFLPSVDFSERPARRQSGFQELGLPFAADPAITRHLAEFLRKHPPADASLPHARPDLLLLNGGFFASPRLSGRLIDVLTHWFQNDPAWSLTHLDSASIDLAVARGAAYFGMVRRGEGVKISAGLARSYYIGICDGVGDQPQALCVAPAGLEPGETVRLTEHPFQLTLAEPVEFPIYYSSVRLTDQPGTQLAVDPESLTPLPPIRTVLRSRKRGDSESVPVIVECALTEIGTLDLACQQRDGKRRWKLQFDVRATVQTDVKAHAGAGEAFGVVEEGVLAQTQEAIEATFRSRSLKARELIPALDEAIGSPRADWPPSLLRELWLQLMNVEPERRKAEHLEARWLNLVGYCLRPGFGLAVDDWRTAQTFKTLHAKAAHGTPGVIAELRVLWRRIGGGLTSGQQSAIADPLLAMMRQSKRQPGPVSYRDWAANPHDAGEVWKLLGSLERLPMRTRSELAERMARELVAEQEPAVWTALVWGLGRVAARTLSYGPLNHVLSPEHVTPWLDLLLRVAASEPVGQLAVALIARRTDDRYRDLSDAMRRRCTEVLTRNNAKGEWIRLIEEGGILTTESQTAVFGEELPKGLRLT